MSLPEMNGELPRSPAASERTVSPAQRQTESTFGYKWARRETYESEAMQAAARAWLFERYCGGDEHVLDNWLAGDPKTILDAGCGAGFSAMLFFGERLKAHNYIGVDISDAVDVAASRFEEAGYPATFMKRDLLDIPVEDGIVDIIFSEGVLHHTDSTEGALKALSSKLRKGGLFLFYVYAKKAVIREFTDDVVREALHPLSDEEAWEALMPLTKLGVELGKLDVELDVPEDIPFLGIKAGRQNLQRFFYWNICKMYYRSEFSLDEMNHINFDWFRPLNCHRQTPADVRRWCEEAGLDIVRMDVQDAGITVVAEQNRDVTR
ncbi:MAG: class I SAM-dependent methyltransferase [Gemmatimonadaceae bacterium]